MNGVVMKTALSSLFVGIYNCSRFTGSAGLYSWGSICLGVGR